MMSLNFGQILRVSVSLKPRRLKQDYIPYHRAGECPLFFKTAKKESAPAP